MLTLFRPATYLLVGLATCACELASSDNTPLASEKIFETLLLRPVPQQVANLHSVGEVQAGYQQFIRFETDRATAGRLLREGYREVNCEVVEHVFQLPPQYRSELPQWHPDITGSAHCFKALVQNSWTTSGRHYVLLREDSSLVYVFADG